MRKRLSRACLKFLSVTPKVTGHQRTSADIGCLPEPEPEPEPDICSSDDERERELFSVDSPPFDTLNENQPPEQSPIWGTKEKRRAFIEGFWAVWPRRIAKAAAEKAWCKLANSPGVADRIIAAVRAQLPALSKDLQFCPYPATWLNEKRYEDDPAEAWRPATLPSPLTTIQSFTPRKQLERSGAGKRLAGQPRSRALGVGCCLDGRHELRDGRANARSRRFQHREAS